VAHAEASARTVEAAATAAAAQLGLRTDQVDIEVLEDPVPSTFGFIGSPARVRVTPRTTPNAPTTSGPVGSASAGSGPVGSGPVRSKATGMGSGGAGSSDLGSTGSVSVGSGSGGSGPTDSGSTDIGPTGSGATGQPARSSEAPQALAPAHPRDSVETTKHDRGTQPASAAPSTPPADPTEVPDPTGTSSGAGSPPDPGAGTPSAPEASDQVPTIAPARTIASGPAAQEPASSLAGAPPVPAAQPPPGAAEGDRGSAGVAAQGEQPPGSTWGASDRAPSIGTRETGPAAVAAAGSASDGAPSATEVPSSATRSPRRTHRDEPIEPAMVEADTERAGDFLEGLLDALDVDGDITTWVDEVGGHIDLEGPDLDMLVGSNGETLDALQELTRLAVLRQSKRRVRLLLDINGYRARQRERLVSIVRATAEQVIRSQEDHEFQPMTPAERKIVHDAVAAIDGVTTESLGEEPNRRVIIQPT
jgi:spoIIIJ-associated protein